MHARGLFARSVLIAVTCLGARAARGAIIVGSWQPIFQGIDYATGAADAKEPRLQQVRVVRVDLREPGIEFFTTPGNGAAPEDTASETTSEFLAHYQLQVAINANFFSPCCTPGDKDLVGLAISRGVVVSRPVTVAGTGYRVLAITRDNHASVIETKKGFSTEGIWTAIAGSDWILIHGEISDDSADGFRVAMAPRSAVGVSKDGRYLFMMTIDGRQPGWSDGATLEDLAGWLRRFGAHEGLALDGGASSTLVREEDGRPVVLNRPSGVAPTLSDDTGQLSLQRVQRSNGNNFGVFARRPGEIFVPGMARP